VSDAHLTDKDVRRIAVEEVTRQVKPLHDWQLAFWSNGSDRPEGYFQMRVKADDLRYKQLIQSINDGRKFWRMILLKIALPVLGATLGLVGWGVRESIPTLRILFEEYIRAHPAVENRMKNESTADPSVLDSLQHQNDPQIMH
jgi:hypothetical protein